MQKEVSVVNPALVAPTLILLAKMNIPDPNIDHYRHTRTP